jgi:hypothetical protein
MKRWLLLGLALLVVATSLFVIGTRLVSHPRSSVSVPVMIAHLERVPNSAYKYHLCSEAFAFAMATADNPYKTDETFRDPFRATNDTIIPRFLGYDQQNDAVSFSVKIIIDRIGIFNETISHVHTRDGISILIPNVQNKLEHSSVPQFIVTLPDDHGNIAVLDYTCPEQWVWRTMHA